MTKKWKSMSNGLKHETGDAKFSPAAGIDIFFLKGSHKGRNWSTHFL